jgi:hypothetical protein
VTPRLFWAVPIVVVAVAAGGWERASSGTAGSVAWAALAGLIAACVAAVAISLPGVDWRGVVFGGLFVGAGVLSWTYTDRPLIVWSVLLVEGLLFLWWSRPWPAGLRSGVRMGTAWLGTSYWILGVLGALLMLHAGMAAQRLLYAGVFGLAVLAVLARSKGRDLSVGVVAAFLVAVALLLLVGSGNLFQDLHAVPANDWGKGFQYRFWGGHALLYHPNSLAGVGVLIALRVGPDRAFALWQRVAVVALSAFLVTVTNSRTGFIFLCAAAVLHAIALFQRRRLTGLPAYRRRWIAAAAPFVAIALILVSAHGVAFLTQERYSSGGVSSGRTDTWKQVITDWRHAGIVEKSLGDTSSVRSTVTRPSSGPDIKLTVDNAVFGALRHGGVLGLLAFLFGLGLLLWNLWRRRADVPAWLVLAALAAIPTIATTEWLLGGTGGTMWILLVTGEAALLCRPQTASTGATTSPSLVTPDAVPIERTA